MKAFGFPKEERLCGKKRIEILFASGNRIFVSPFRIAFLPYDLPEAGSQIHPLQILISVPKRNFRKAHDRNHVKRQIREAWRISKSPLMEKISGLSSENKMKALHIAFLYQPDVKEEWPVLLEAMKKAISILSKKALD